MPDLILRRAPISATRLVELRDGLLASPLLSRSTLAGSFRGSRGYATTFTDEGLAAVKARFPLLTDFLAEALCPATRRALLPFPSRLLKREPARTPNAYYVNLLVLGNGDKVGRHIDGTLREPSQVPSAVPEFVSVLYLATPPRAEGGQLRVYRGRRLVGAVTPRPGLWVQFRGELDHEITELGGASTNEVRASLVCEHYAFAAPALSRLVPMAVQSKAGFAAYFEDHQTR